MPIVAIAVLGRLGHPLYLSDFASPLLFDIYTQPTSSQPDDDFFCDSIVECTTEQHSEWPCRMKHQFALFAAYERISQMLDGGWKVPRGIGADACWMGLVCTVNGYNAYGYATTNTKYIILAEDVIAPDDIQLQKACENDLKMIMSQIHGLYTDHLLNPFTQPNTKINSKRFNAGIQNLANGFNTRRL